MPVRRESLSQRGAVLTMSTAFLWFLHFVDPLLPAGLSVARGGIVPRTEYGLYEIPAAPLIHASWAHLTANTLPLLILGAIVLFRGVSEFFYVTVMTILIGGLGTWLFGTGNSRHIGASGIVFGLFGYLISRALFDRRLTSALATLAVAMLYGSAMTWSLIPTPEISWTGHFFGFLGGVAAARMRYPGR